MLTTFLLMYFTSLSSISYYWVLYSNVYYLTFREVWLHIVLDLCVVFFYNYPTTSILQWMGLVKVDHDNSF